MFSSSVSDWCRLQTTGMCFVRMDTTDLSENFNSILTQKTIHPFSPNHPGTALIDMRLYKIWWYI